MAIAGAEDDRLLLGPADGDEMVEKVGSHDRHPLGEKQAILEGRRFVPRSRLRPADDLAGVRVPEHLVPEALLVDAGLALVHWAVVEEDVTPDDLARREIAVLDALAHAVLVGGLAEVAEVVGVDLAIGVGFAASLVDFELPRRGGEPDLDGVRVPRQDLRPLAPRRAVTFVDHDVAEVVLGVVRGQERRGAVLGVDVQGLVGGDQDAGVLLRIPAGHGSRIGPELVLKSAEGLASEFVAVANEQRPAKLARVRDLPQELHCDVGFPRSGREREERPLLASRELLQHGPDGRILVIAPRPLPAVVAHEQRAGQG